MNTCYIFGAADGLPEKFEREDSDLVIAADAGIRFLEKLNILPDIAVGDFDSLGFIPDCKEVIQHPVMKNDTDTMLAVKTGFERGFKRFVIYGGAGGRPDHTYANYQTLCYISTCGGKGFLCFNGYTATAVRNGSVSFANSASGNISVFSASGKISGVTLKGLLYELQNAVLDFDFPLGVSNEFIGENAEITVSNGTAIVIWSGGINDLCEKNIQ